MLHSGGEGVALESRLLALDRRFVEDIDLEGRELTIWHGRFDANLSHWDG
jgi:hypothetical protein